MPTRPNYDKPSTTGWYPPAPRIVSDEERGGPLKDNTSAAASHYPQAPRVVSQSELEAAMPHPPLARE